MSVGHNARPRDTTFAGMLLTGLKAYSSGTFADIHIRVPESQSGGQSATESTGSLVAAMAFGSAAGAPTHEMVAFQIAVDCL
ncbi:hypothetical protein ACRE_090130 [Hapsidospora chrysogenum ATCC 11550]|uniref:Uncharacterized protein n=1 Tax=Hapsidospora chrysogenum (strain ATCC 11550 / CBS 779.69 / DSM 880 / IAM 14645 / JCM 23072 / IMI 49137) TaxID=857340 RepID=A0A086ST98_HAPC1|nr:hypothetical protein ACRE_090130 [Hapsidospora chrysogenum ATCC 11550]